ncbi:MAG: MoaD/ThiS family protein [Pseudomonadota bacterium]|nr:MAG: MoaD/ThiS family protein [Pseudomonadota bacterium]
MSIHVKFFASLREQMQRAEASVEAGGVATVADVWNAVAGDEPLPPNVLTAVNLEYVAPGHDVRDGDEVAFFPPVTGG